MTTITLFLIVSLFFAGFTLLVGVVCGLWLAQARTPARSAKSKNPVTPAADTAGLERARILSASLVQMAQQLACEIDVHSSKVESISADLCGVDLSRPEGRAVLTGAPDRLLAANLLLQEQLATAKQQIESQAAELRLRESEARTDSLTKLGNRRAFEEELSQQLALWNRKQIPVSLLLLDVDNFKTLNDSFGHQFGDLVLQQLAQIIIAQLREMDLSFRYGGEEFAVILPATDLADATNVAERIRGAVASAEVVGQGKQKKVTVTGGVAAAVQSDQPENLVSRADAALYRGKRTGKNRIQQHTGRKLEAHSCSKSAQPCPQSATPVAPCPAPVATLNRELTRLVCESRRSNGSLMLAAVRISARGSRASSREFAHELLMRAIERTGEYLPASTVVPLSAVEFVILYPNFSQNFALDDLTKILHTIARDCYPAQVEHHACELLPLETAEALLLRTREGLLAASTPHN